ncbi:hypothetical protein [Streptomyces sp. NPDC087294]|uniref:hypothetical protein n=1 Tax=Streptomyces sp. NPDC087294 TaxID=3365777 RepID=UPI003827A29C
MTPATGTGVGPPARPRGAAGVLPALPSPVAGPSARAAVHRGSVAPSSTALSGRRALRRGTAFPSTEPSGGDR